MYLFLKLWFPSLLREKVDIHISLSSVCLLKVLSASLAV